MLYILIIFLIIISFYNFIKYKSFTKPPENFNDYIKKYSNIRVSPFNKNKSIKILEEALNINNISEFEKKSLMLELGLLYGNNKDYAKSIYYLDQAFLNLDPRIRYNSSFIKALKIYLLADESQKAQKVFSNLIKLEKYDPKFKELLLVKDEIFNQ